MQMYIQPSSSQQGRPAFLCYRVYTQSLSTRAGAAKQRAKQLTLYRNTEMKLVVTNHSANRGVGRGGDKG